MTTVQPTIRPQNKGKRDSRYELSRRSNFLDVGHADRLVVAGAQALSHRQMLGTTVIKATDSLFVTILREIARELAAVCVGSGFKPVGQCS